MTAFELFRKPNEQNQTRLSSAMARTGARSELKTSLLNSIQEIDDNSLLERISRYVKKAIGESKKNRITKADLVIDPRALDIVKDIKGGPAIDDKAAMHKHWEEKYK